MTIDEVTEMEAEAEEWRIEWSDGSSRTTTLAGLAYYAKYWDDEATVIPL